MNLVHALIAAVQQLSAGDLLLDSRDSKELFLVSDGFEFSILRYQVFDKVSTSARVSW